MGCAWGVYVCVWGVSVRVIVPTEIAFKTWLFIWVSYKIIIVYSLYEHDSKIDKTCLFYPEWSKCCNCGKTDVRISSQRDLAPAGRRYKTESK